jgi:hypothetical protein
LFAEFLDKRRRIDFEEFLVAFNADLFEMARVDPTNAPEPCEIFVSERGAIYLIPHDSTANGARANSRQNAMSARFADFL